MMSEQQQQQQQPPEPPLPPSDTSAASEQLHQEESELTAVPATSEILQPQQPEDSLAAEEDEEGAEGTRARMLRATFMRALRKSVEVCSHDNFAMCFPTTTRENPGLVQQMHTRIVGHMMARAPAEFDAIISNRGAVRKLNALDMLLDEAETRRREAPPGFVPIAPSTLPPAAVVEAHVTPLLRAAQQREETRLGETRRSTDVLMGEIVEQRRIIGELLARLEEARGAFGEAVEDVQTAARAADIREVEEMEVDKR